jgi:hypothetical protein
MMCTETELTVEVTPQFPVFIIHCLNPFLRVVFLMVFLTQLTAILHVEFRVYYHNFHILSLWFNKLSNPGRLWLFLPESITLLVNSLTYMLKL